MFMEVTYHPYKLSNHSALMDLAKKFGGKIALIFNWGMKIFVQGQVKSPRTGWKYPANWKENNFSYILSPLGNDLKP